MFSLPSPPLPHLHAGLCTHIHRGVGACSYVIYTRVCKGQRQILHLAQFLCTLFLKFFKYLLLFYESFVYINVCVSCTSLVLMKAREGVGSPETGVIESCQLPCGCWELKPCRLQEQHVLLTTSSVSSPCTLFFETELKLEFTDSARLTGQRAPKNLLSLSPQAGMEGIISFFCGCWESEFRSLHLQGKSFTD